MKTIENNGFFYPEEIANIENAIQKMVKFIIGERERDTGEVIVSYRPSGHNNFRRAYRGTLDAGPGNSCAEAIINTLISHPQVNCVSQIESTALAANEVNCYGSSRIFIRMEGAKTELLIASSFKAPDYISELFVAAVHIALASSGTIIIDSDGLDDDPVIGPARYIALRHCAIATAAA